MSDSQKLNGLIEALQCMPGIGKKSAQRIAYYLLQRNRDSARHLSSSLKDAMDNIGHCKRCRNFTENELCHYCQSHKRERSLICVVESPADVSAVEEAGFRGLYYVLMGHLSPLDGIGPEELGLKQFEALLHGGETKEVILATNSTVEGEATAHFISELVRKRGLKVTRIAHGVPMGGELEYIDSNTLSHAINGRQLI